MTKQPEGTRYEVGLYVVSQQLRVEEIHEELGLAPDFVWRRGEDTGRIRRKESTAIYVSRLSEAGLLHDQIEELLSRFEQAEARPLTQLRRLGRQVSARLQITCFIEAHESSLVLDSAHLRRIADAGVPVRVQSYVVQPE